MLFPASKHVWLTWQAFARASLVREMEFRGNFILGLIRQFLWLFVFILMIEVIFQHVHELAGWQKYEVLIIISLSRLTEGIMGVLFIRNIMDLPNRVREGLFDFHVTKPVSALFYTTFRRVDIQNFGNILAGLVILAYALALSPEHFSFSNTLFFVLLSLSGMVIYYSLLVIASTLVFILDRLEFLWGFNILMSEPLTVPFGVFPTVPRLAITYIIPLAFVVFVPAQALTGRLAWWQIPVALAFAAFFLLLANLAWRAGLKKYSSASS